MMHIPDCDCMAGYVVCGECGKDRTDEMEVVLTKMRAELEKWRKRANAWQDKNGAWVSCGDMMVYRNDDDVTLFEVAQNIAYSHRKRWELHREAVQ